MSINIKEIKYTKFVVARSSEEAMTPWCYKEAPPQFDTLQEAEANKTSDTNIYEFECTKHQITSG